MSRAHFGLRQCERSDHLDAILSDLPPVRLAHTAETARLFVRGERELVGDSGMLPLIAHGFTHPGS